MPKRIKPKLPKTAPIKKGSLVLCTNGEHSDYRVLMVCKVLTGIDAMALRSEYLTLYPDQSEDYAFDASNFCKWLVADKKVCREIKYCEWYLGGYAGPDFFVDYIKGGDHD